MELYHVVAMANHNVIGKDNKLPWHFPSDLKFFKQLTTGHAVVMGRKTFESIIAAIGKPLPDRKSFVLTRNPDALPAYPNVWPIDNPDILCSLEVDKCFIIGGADVFKQTIDGIDGIYLTRIYADFPGDAFYPEVPEDFQEQSRTKLQDNPKIEVIYYERI